MTTEKVTKSVCRICGASYSSGSQAKGMHTKSTGHNDWKRVSETRDKAPSKATYLDAWRGQRSRAVMPYDDE